MGCKQVRLIALSAFFACSGAYAQNPVILPGFAAADAPQRGLFPSETVAISGDSATVPGGVPASGTGGFFLSGSERLQLREQIRRAARDIYAGNAHQADTGAITLAP